MSAAELAAAAEREPGGPQNAEMPPVAEHDVSQDEQ